MSNAATFSPVTATTDNGVGTLNFCEDSTVWGRLRTAEGFTKFKGTWTAEGAVTAQADDGRTLSLRAEKFAGAVLRGTVVDSEGVLVAIVAYAPKSEGVTTYGLSKEPTQAPAVVPFR
jgi:hypothetical protein